MNRSLVKFKAINEHISVIEETEHVNVQNLWSDNTFMCRFKNNEKFTCLENILLPTELAALYDKKNKFIEFIFAPLDITDHLITRKFDFYYKGISFKAEFSPPSEAMKLLANGFRELTVNSATNYRNLIRFRDYYKRDAMPKYVQTYFDEKIPIVFKISGDFEAIDMDFVSFSKNLNFYLDYYDRTTPYILIYDKEAEDIESYSVPCYSDKNDFPKNINVRSIDPVLVDLFDIARITTNTRMCFLFYFQVLEYCSYYHLSEEIKKKLTNIIKRPDLLNNPSYYGKLITEEFRDNFKNNTDPLMLEKLIVEFITFDDIKFEIEENLSYFTQEILFDGGFKVDGLINSINDIETPPKGIIKIVKTNIEKIRNVLVHIRESRENKIILPTKRNTNLLLPYLHLIKRIAEKVAIQYE